MNAPSISIRRLKAGEAARLRDLNAFFGEAFDEPEAYGAAPPTEHYLNALLGSASFVALVAEQDGEVIGGLAAYELVKFEQARSELYIYDLAVAEAFRRLGVATGLIEALKPIAKAMGAWVIFVQADAGDDPAIALYSKLGVREDVLHFDIAVE